MESRNRPPSSSPGPLRLFWGIQTGPEGVAALRRWRAAVALPQARWPHPEDLHLTLAFLGARPAAEVPAIVAAGRAAAAGTPALQLQSAALGQFPGRGRARVLWLGLAADPGLAALAARMQAAMSPFGCKAEPGPWIPHLTLARFPVPRPLPHLPAVEPFRFAPAAAVLLHSSTGAAGPRYLELAAVPFNP